MEDGKKRIANVFVLYRLGCWSRSIDLVRPSRDEIAYGWGCGIVAEDGGDVR